MTTREKALYAVIAEVRTCFHQLRTLTDALHADRGVTAGMRGVMESLAAKGSQTVPAIARSKSVSRQHIQTIVNELAAAGLVAAGDNPAHARSPVFDLTAKGRRLFTAAAAQEQAPLARLAADMPHAKLAEVQKILSALNRRLAEEIAAEEKRHVAA